MKLKQKKTEDNERKWKKNAGQKIKNEGEKKNQNIKNKSGKKTQTIKNESETKKRRR